MFDGPYRMPIKAPHSLEGLECEWCNRQIQQGEEVIVYPSLRIFHTDCAEEWEVDEGELPDDF